jgi:hypothetical protein
MPMNFKKSEKISLSCFSMAQKQKKIIFFPHFSSDTTGNQIAINLKNKEGNILESFLVKLNFGRK